MRSVLYCLLIVLYSCAGAQKIETAAKSDPIISAKEVERIERVLAADSMQGRRSGTEGSDKAARFIADEFSKAGLQPLQGASFLQEFTMVRPKNSSVKADIDSKAVESKDIAVITTQKALTITDASGYEIVHIAAGQSWAPAVQTIMRARKNTVAFVDTSFTRNFAGLNRYRRQLFTQPHSVVFVLGNYTPKKFTIKVEQDTDELKLTNVVGVLPGKGRKEEQVVFSAHYDHLGIGRPQNGDSIYNGANDDAAGTTAVIMLAHHFKKLNNNERTLVFAAFTAEEIGGFGSQYFSQSLKPESVAAMFNIEMIGTESKWGKNSAYITGYDKTDMGTILQQNLTGSAFTFHPDPYPEQQLFYRSDNATLARLGVPAHTISTAKMDAEKWYHSADDEVETLDLVNMTEIIKAIAQSSKTIISGQATPSRVKTEELR